MGRNITGAALMVERFSRAWGSRDHSLGRDGVSRAWGLQGKKRVIGQLAHEGGGFHGLFVSRSRPHFGEGRVYSDKGVVVEGPGRTTEKKVLGTLPGRGRREESQNSCRTARAKAGVRRRKDIG